MGNSQPKQLEIVEGGGVTPGQDTTQVVFVDSTGTPVLVGLPAVPEAGTYVLTSTDGVVSWVEAT